MTIIVRTLTEPEILTLESLVSTSQAVASQTVDSNEFVFFAGFDGTNNDKDNLPLSGNPLQTNVANLWDQAYSSAGDQAQYFKGGYYA